MRAIRMDDATIKWLDGSRHPNMCCSVVPGRMVQVLDGTGPGNGEAFRPRGVGSMGVTHGSEMQRESLVKWTAIEKIGANSALCAHGCHSWN